MSKNNLIIVGKHDIINVKNFENIDEFNDYYKLHEDEINKLSTVKLNKIYHIKGFKIVRRKINENEEKTLAFHQVFKTNSNENNNDDRFTEIEQSITDLNEKLKAIELANEKLKKQVIEIINVINSSN